MSSVKLEQILEGRRSQPAQLIEVLMDIQRNFGYISEEAMKVVSRELGVPLIEVYRVACFYKAFRLKPTGKNVITICMGTACHVRGARLLLDQATGYLGIGLNEVTPDGLFSVQHVNCLGACAMGPVVVENGSYHGQMTPVKVRRLIDALKRGEKAEGGNAQA